MKSKLDSWLNYQISKHLALQKMLGNKNSGFKPYMEIFNISFAAQEQHVREKSWMAKGKK